MTTQPSEVSWISRQFAANVTPKQVGFDVLFGIMMPIVCFLLDPILQSTGSLDWYWLYLFVGLAMLGLCTWLATGWLPAFFAGFFTTAAACAGLIGVLLLPMSLIGLMFGIGALGFVPFLTSFVYFRNAVRAWRANETELGPLGALAGLALAFAPAVYPMYGHSLIAEATRAAIQGDTTRTDALVARIRSMPLPVSADSLVWEYIAQDSAAARERLADAYEQITGEEIHGREAQLDWD